VEIHLTVFEHTVATREIVLGEKKTDKRDYDFTKPFEEFNEASENVFGPEDRQLLREMMQRLNEIKEALDAVQFKLGVEKGVWRKFPDGDVEWTFAQTMDGEQVEGLDEIINTLNRNEAGSWVQIGTFEYRWSGTEDAPKKFIHRRLAK
jgi:hypothetical protein